MTIKTTYFEKRLKKIESSDRSGFAKREIQTLHTLERLANGNFLCAGASVADIGCGDQFLKPEFEALGMNYRGFDINTVDIEVDPLPLPDESHDLLVSYALMEHLKSPDNMITESRRCLKPGGYLMINTPNWWYSSDIFFDDYTHVKPYSPVSLRALLNDFGFSDVWDFPNLRCKGEFSYSNRYRYYLANLRPFSAHFPFSKFVPGFLKGKAKGMFILAKK